MFVKSISADNFKKFNHLDVSFPADLTVVKGPNEQGKSSLLEALLAGLFYDPKKSNQQISALQSWNSDKLYSITITLEHNGQDIVLYKNFETRELTLENKNTSKKLNTYSTIGDYLYEIGALRSLALFESTACVKHDAMVSMTEGKREISQALQSLMTASGEGVSSEKILKKINESISSLLRGTKQQAKNPGLLKKLENEIAENLTRKDKIVASLADMESKSAYLADTNSTLENLRKDYEMHDSQYQKNITYFKTIQDLEKLHLQVDRANSDFDTLMEIANKKGYFVVQLEKMKGLRSIDLEKLYGQKEVLHAKQVKLKSITAETKEINTDKKKSTSHVKMVHVGISALFFIIGFLGFIRTELFALWGLFVAAFTYSFIFRQGIVTHTGKQLNAELESLEHEIAVLEKQMNKILEENGVKTDDELVAKIKKYNEFGQELAKLESKEEGILRSGSFEDFKKERNELLKRIAIEETKISDEEKVTPPTATTQRTLEHDRERVKLELDKVEKEVSRLQAIMHSEFSREDLVKTEEEIEYKQVQKRNAENKLKILELLTETLTEAQTRTIAQSRAVIEDYMRRYLPAITNGRYTNVRIKDDLTFEVWSDEKKGMVVPEENLSRGTVDQFYLAARFAVLALLNKGTRSLVLLDDPFSAFDNTRREKTKQMLADMTESFQIILFTHASDYDDWGSVVTL